MLKAEIDDSPDVLCWLNHILIRLCRFMFQLRRSKFLQMCSNRADETGFYWYVSPPNPVIDTHADNFHSLSDVLNEADVNNSLIMIHLPFMSYTLNDPLQPMLLDSIFIKVDVTLLNTFLHILTFYGETIARWCKARYLG